MDEIQQVYAQVIQIAIVAFPELGSMYFIKAFPYKSRNSYTR